MKNSFVLKYILLLLAIFISFLGYKLYNQNAKQKATVDVQQKISYEAKTDSRGKVEVKVTPKLLSAEQNTSFAVSMNTHEVDLAYDLAKEAILTDDLGNRYEPISWSGPKTGHHSEGLLVFPPLAKNAKQINLILPKIDGIDRSFSWDI